MRPHARAMILLGGWLLMIAPPAPNRGGPLILRNDENAPIRLWKQWAAYDTAADCEWVRARFDVSLNKDDGSQIPVTQAEIEEYRARDLRCVPAESIYPPQQSNQK